MFCKSQISNGDFFFIEDDGKHLQYTIVNLSKAVYGNMILFEQEPTFFGLAFDGGSDESGVGKVRYARDKIRITR